MVSDSVWPCGMEAWFREVISGVPACTVKPFVSVATSVPVVTVTLCGPTGAFATMVACAVRQVGQDTATPVIGDTRSQVHLRGLPERNGYLGPTIPTGPPCPCWPEFGEMVLMAGRVDNDVVTVKPFGSESTSGPVVTVTVRFPNAAAGSIRIVAVTSVASVTVTVPTVIPAPRLTWLVP